MTQLNILLQQQKNARKNSQLEAKITGFLEAYKTDNRKAALRVYNELNSDEQRYIQEIYPIILMWARCPS